MREDRIAMLHDTLSIFERGYYTIDGRRKSLKLTGEQTPAARVFLPDEVHSVCKTGGLPRVHVLGRCRFGCENADSFSLARRVAEDSVNDPEGGDAKPVLVLNLANPVNPGGGVRKGAKAQEEDLCRKSSLLLSLEGAEAAEYYRYNRGLHTYMGSDAVMIHPRVEIIKGDKGELLEDSVVVAVMTCAAPMLTFGMEGMTQAEYEAMVRKRITGMLNVAASLGYDRLVLGAFGCGAFENDAHIVSDLFYKALKEFKLDGLTVNDLFRSIDFAVLDNTESKYNFNEFSRNFADFYRDEDKTESELAAERIKASEVRLDAIRGCLYGGAVGDALGYPVEFLSENAIFRAFGEGGITHFLPDIDGTAHISDDTQMTLFTANGLLVGDTRGAMRGIQSEPRHYVEMAYQDWLLTQVSTIEEVNSHARYTKVGGFSWLLDVPELYSRRAPGNTCLSSLLTGAKHNDYVAAKINDSKGCGGIMRVAPLALNYRWDMASLDMEGAQLAAVTHGNSLGYMPAAVLVHIINRIVFRTPGTEVCLKGTVLEARDKAVELFAGDEHLGELIDIIDLAVELSENSEPDLDNTHRLGEGWVAEETLGIALYCALRYEDDFSKGVIAAVNHNGDSDSTGAVTGNILGALLGYGAIEEKWKDRLELSDVILEMADDICHGCQMSEYSSYNDPAWTSKYIRMRRYAKSK